MNHLQILLLAVGLALISFNDIVSDGFALREAGNPKQLRYFLFLLTATILYVILGLFIGTSIGIVAGKVNAPIASAMLIAIGLKIMVEELLVPSAERINPASDIQTLIRTTLADGITPFIVSVAVGLLHIDFLSPLLILASVITFSAASGMLTGRTKIQKTKPVKLAAFGGLILLAAGLKMLITLLGQ
jgi:putative Mn2+ efflux pump MntP